MKYIRRVWCASVIYLLCSGFFLFSDEIENNFLSLEYSACDSIVAHNVFREYTNIAKRIQRFCGFYDVPQVTVLLSHSDKEFSKFVEAISSLPDHTVAIADQQNFRIIIQHPKYISHRVVYSKVLAHEYTHCLLSAVVKNRSTPLWFQEGFAQYCANQWSWEREFQFVRAIMGNRAISLSFYKNHYPRFPDQVEMFYAQSYYVVREMVKEYQLNHLQEFIEKLSNTSFEKAFYLTYGVSSTNFLQKVYRNLSGYSKKQIYKGIFTLSGGLFPFLLLVTYVLKCRKNRREYKKLVEVEDELATKSDKNDAGKCD